MVDPTMTHRDIFCSLGPSCFWAGENLPEAAGDMSSYYVINVQTTSQFTPVKLQNAIIEAFDRTPEWSIVKRDRQLDNLLTASAENGKKVVVIITDAHQLPLRTLRAIKCINETRMWEDPRIGFVFLGNPTSIKKRLDKIGDIKCRTNWM